MSKADKSAITLKSRHRVASNSKWDVYFDHIRDAQGLEVPDYLVIAPQVQGDDLVTGVSVLPLYEDGSAVLQRVWRHAVRASMWEVVRGFVDAGETPATSALRELEEEVGLTCAPHELIALGHTTPEGSTIQARVALFAATNCRAGTEGQREPELGLGAASRHPFAEVLAMANDSRIQDATSLLAIYRYQALFGF